MHFLLLQFTNVFVHFIKCISPNHWTYLFLKKNIFVEMANPGCTASPRRDPAISSHLRSEQLVRPWLQAHLGETLVDRPTQLICISDIYLYLSTDKYKRHSRVIFWGNMGKWELRILRWCLFAFVDKIPNHAYDIHFKLLFWIKGEILKNVDFWFNIHPSISLVFWWNQNIKFQSVNRFVELR